MLAAGAGTGPALILVQPPVPLGDPAHPGSGVPVRTAALRGAVRARKPPLGGALPRSGTLLLLGSLPLCFLEGRFIGLAGRFVELVVVMVTGATVVPVV